MPESQPPSYVGSSKADILSQDRFRHEQVTALARRSGTLAIGSIVSALATLYLFWGGRSDAYLVGLVSSLVVIHGAAMASSRFWLAGHRRAVSASKVRLRGAIAALIAAVWCTAAFVLMPSATIFQREFLIFIASGLMSSSVLLAPILAASLAFSGITAVGFAAAVLPGEGPIAIEHAVLIVTYLFVVTVVAVAQNRDFTQQTCNEFTLTDQGDIIGLLLREFEESASDWLWEADEALRLPQVSERFARVLGVDAVSLRGASLVGWIKRGAHVAGAEQNDAAELLAAFEARAPFRDLHVLVAAGEKPCWLSLTGKPVFDQAGAFGGYRGVGTDITAVRALDERVSFLASFDSLTGLPNRAQFGDALTQACARSAALTVMLLDLDGFKSVNDTNGHAAGDALLVAVAGRLRGCLRSGDLVARLGGDEFALLCDGDDVETAQSIAQRLIASVSQPYLLGTLPVTVGVSVGLAYPRDAGWVPQNLLQGADLALYVSKAEGRGTWHVFEPAMAERARERQAIQADLRRAIDNEQLFLEFQPILDLKTQRVIGAEALVRWLHPRRGRVSPADFIPLAEESGLILPLGAWVLRRACQEAAGWPAGVRVAVNLSPAQFRDPGLLDLIGRVLAETGLPASCLELEITESVFLDAQETTVACLNTLRSLGIHIALDDFGTGYSSLSYLRSFPFDKVKIDQSFIRDLGQNEDAIAIVQAIVGMAGSLGMRTTGEGVETSLQARMLQHSGCSQVQGYLFGRPCSARTIGGLLQADSPARTAPELAVLDA